MAPVEHSLLLQTEGIYCPFFQGRETLVFPLRAHPVLCVLGGWLLAHGSDEGGPGNDLVVRASPTSSFYMKQLVWLIYLPSKEPALLSEE